MGRVPAVRPAALLRNKKKRDSWYYDDIKHKRSNTTEAGQTFVKTVLIHRPVNVEVLPGHQGELCLRMLVRPIVRIVTTAKNKQFSCLFILFFIKMRELRIVWVESFGPVSYICALRIPIIFCADR